MVKYLWYSLATSKVAALAATPLNTSLYVSVSEAQGRRCRSKSTGAQWEWPKSRGAEGAAPQWHGVTAPPTHMGGMIRGRVAHTKHAQSKGVGCTP